MNRADEYEHPGLMYVASNIPGPGSRPDDFQSVFSTGCTCDDRQCRGADCSCTRGILNYVDERLTEGNINSIVECNVNCTCDETTCNNRLVQRGPLDCLVVLDTGNWKGLGLFTKEPITKGRFICEYAGEVIDIEEARLRLEANRARGLMNYVLVVREYVGEDSVMTTCIDPGLFGNVGRYANHSCRPNAQLMPVRVDIVVPRLCLFAIEDIAVNEEITFDYSGGADNSVQNLSETICCCGADNCLGYLPHCPV